ncbi:MAG: hypothetical protein JWP47_2341 [Polaromonas sp.]|jgi:hypothetical protein|nr:hypothetical protein [Polaromonas sp.]
MLEHRASDTGQGRHDMPVDRATTIAPSASLVARVRQRLFPPSLPDADACTDSDKPSVRPALKDMPVTVKQKVGLQASIAELLLVNRLKARAQRDPSARILERATHIIFVTCQHWFAHPGKESSRHETRL